jgi:hypothetical protein
MCTPVIPAVPYLLLGLQDVQWAVGNSRGARKLARTPHVKKEKRKKRTASLYGSVLEDVYSLHHSRYHGMLRKNPFLTSVQISLLVKDTSRLD